jgi:nicotinamidase/pyrazinamidase
MSQRALILVDLQNDFMPHGALPVPDALAVVETVNGLLPFFSVVVVTRDWHPRNHVSFAVNHPGMKPGQIVTAASGRQVLWPVRCVQWTPGAALVGTLELESPACVIHKGQDPNVDSYSAFFDNPHEQDTGLMEFLDAREIDTLFVAGVATEYCVKFTALDAVALGFMTYVVADACGAINASPDDGLLALEDMRQQGVEAISAAKAKGLMRPVGFDIVSAGRLAVGINPVIGTSRWV